MESLLASDYPEEKLELIVVDNASTDGTAEILAGYKSRVTVLSERKRGAAAARNRGLREAGGDVIAFTDADCEVDRQWLRNLVPPLQDESVGIVGGRILSKRPCNSIELFGEKIHDHEKAITRAQPPYAITMNWGSRISVLRQVNFFDEAYLRCQDVDLSLRIASEGLTLLFEPRAVVRHGNERTYSGLLGEGFKHGLWAVRVLREHRSRYPYSRSSRVDARGYRGILRALLDALKGRDRGESLCYLAFNSGKKLGRLVGSIRFWHLRL